MSGVGLTFTAQCKDHIDSTSILSKVDMCSISSEATHPEGLQVANLHDTAQLSMTQVAFVNKPSINIADMFKTSAPTDDVKMTDAIGLPAASGLRSGAPGIFSYLEQLAEVAATRSAEDEKTQLKDAGESAMTTDVSLDSDGTGPYAINSKILIKRTATSLRDNSRTQESLKRRCLAQTSPLTTVTTSSEAHTFVPRKDLVGQPPELRDAIYTQTVFERDPISLDRVCMPEICRTNKQVLGEAMPIYFAVNRFKGCLHMPHTFEAALNPADNHKTFKPATICPSNILRMSKPCFGDFAIKDVKFDIIDVDHAHFASLEISISKRGAGTVKITCTEGPEMVAESEKSMCSDMKTNLEPIIRGMMARKDFRGLTVDDLKLLADNIVVPFDPEDDESANAEVD